jgi:hypothetical protein
MSVDFRRTPNPNSQLYPRLAPPDVRRVVTSRVSPATPLALPRAPPTCNVVQSYGRLRPVIFETHIAAFQRGGAYCNWEVYVRDYQV